MATIEELQAELAKRDEQIRGISTKLAANERIVKELGEAVERDAYGNPMRIVAEEEPTVTSPPPPTGTPGNPWTPLASYVPEFNPQNAEAYYQQQFNALLAKQGYVTTAQANALVQQAITTVNGNAAVWRMHDRLTAQESYKSLTDVKSPLYERTAKVLQERRLGAPLQADPITGEPLTGPVPFDRWQFRDLEALRFGADYASMELEKEAKAAEAAKASATVAQQAGNLSPTPQATGGAAAPAGTPDLTTSVTPGGEISPELAEAIAKETEARR